MDCCVHVYVCLYSFVRSACLWCRGTVAPRAAASSDASRKPQTACEVSTHAWEDRTEAAAIARASLRPSIEKDRPTSQVWLWSVHISLREPFGEKAEDITIEITIRICLTQKINMWLGQSQGLSSSGCASRCLADAKPLPALFLGPPSSPETQIRVKQKHKK